MIFNYKNVLRNKFPSVVKMYKILLNSYYNYCSYITIKNTISSEKIIYLELGAGSKKGGNGWLTVDVIPGCDIYYNLRKGIPFPDNSVNKIYSSHFFEHLSSEEIILFLKECKRVLIPGGNFSICVPNAKIYIENYYNNTILQEQDYFSYKPAYNFYSMIDYVNYIAYMGGEHKHLFDEDNLLAILRFIGFDHVATRPFDPNLDLIKRHHLSIYAEASKGLEEGV